VKLCTEWLHRLLGGYAPRVESPLAEWKELAAALDGRRVLRALCKGKHLFVEFDGDRFLWNHMVVEGRWRRVGPDDELPEGTWLALRVPRATVCNLHGEKLGLLDEREMRARLESLGVDVMSAPFPAAEVAAAIRASEHPIGEALLEQSHIAGVGETARSEALFLAQIDPRAPGCELSERAAQRLALALHRVTLESYQAGGRWVLRVHRRGGRRCPTCGSEILHVRQAATDTFLCPHCQRFRAEDRAAGVLVPAVATREVAEGDATGTEAPGAPAPRLARAGRRFAIGCAVWSFAGWVGSFYPRDASSRDFLELYGHRLTAVEGNTTFYAIPPSETVARWAERLPPGFRFCPKLYRYVTHRGLLEKEIGITRQFVDHVLLLGDRLGPVFAQLPASYGPEHAADLEAFVTSWPHAEVPLAVELRHPGWYAGEARRRLVAVLAEHGTGRVVLDSRPLYEGHDGHGDLSIDPERRKPLLPVQPRATSTQCLVRFVGHPDRARNRPYLEEWSRTVARWLEEGRDVTFFAHCPREEQSPFIARDFQRVLEETGVEVDPLPWDAIVGETVQGDLFDA